MSRGINVMNRTIEQIFPSIPTQDGAGVKINRNVVHGKLSYFDPFLMLDEILAETADDYIAGFPAHPHRGFETVTYMLDGRMRHEDHMGNVGILKSGGVQWMTAGKGVIHSEMPEQEAGRMHGFQLWVNLPAKDKMTPARYQEFEPEEITETTTTNGNMLRLIAGQHQNLQGPVSEVATQPLFIDARIAAGSEESFDINPEHTALVYVYEGSIDVAGKTIARGHMAKLTAGEQLTLSNSHAYQTGLLLLAGKPLKEPIANYGPFVMNTRDEIEQAMKDYQSGNFT